VNNSQPTKDLKQSVQRHLARRYDPLTNPMKKQVLPILRKFFHYSLIAAMHGYSIRKSYRGKTQRFEFSLYYTYIKKLNFSRAPTIAFNPLAYGYLFVFVAHLPIAKLNGFYFTMKKKYMDMAKEITMSDKIYQLINKQK
jgi:hypothetical protein